MFLKKLFSREKKERRRFQRIDLFQASYCKLIDEVPESLMHDCWINNISLGGICFDLKEDDLEDEDKIVILFKIGAKFRKDKAVIKNARKVFNNWRYGCEFIEEIDDERDSVILKYINSLKQKG